MAIELISKAKCFDGYQNVYQHFSSEVGCVMKFSVYEPLNCDEPADVLFFLTGLGNSEQNFMCYAGAQSYASQHRFIVVGPDTSPRGLNLPGETESRYIGEGAGLYVPGRYKRSMGQELPNVFLCDKGAHKFSQKKISHHWQNRNFRSQHGRSRCIGLRTSKS